MRSNLNGIKLQRGSASSGNVLLLGGPDRPFGFVPVSAAPAEAPFVFRRTTAIRIGFFFVGCEKNLCSFRNVHDDCTRAGDLIEIIRYHIQSGFTSRINAK